MEAGGGSGCLAQSGRLRLRPDLRWHGAAPGSLALVGGWSVDSFILARSAPPVTVCTCTKPARVPTHKPPFRPKPKAHLGHGSAKKTTENPPYILKNEANEERSCTFTEFFRSLLGFQ